MQAVFWVVIAEWLEKDIIRRRNQAVVVSVVSSREVTSRVSGRPPAMYQLGSRGIELNRQ
jgi:hypothetical protein